MAKALLIPRRPRTRWLKAEPSPGKLNSHGADGVVAGFGEAPLIGGGPTRLGGGGQAAERPDFFAVAKGPPAEAFQDKAPGTIRPNPFQGEELPHLLHHRLLGRLQHRTAFGFQLGKALGQRLHVLPLLAKPVSQSRRERRASPQAKGRQLHLEVAAGGQHEALRREQPLDAVDDPRPIPFRGRQGAMELTAIFFRHTGDTNDTPHPLFPGDITEEHGEQLMHLATIRLRSTVTTIDFNAGRVHADVLHPLSHSTAVEPKAIPAGFVTTDDPGVCRSSKPPLGPGHLLSEAVDVPSCHCAFAWPLRHPGRETQFPGRDAEFKGQEQGRPVCRCLTRVGRR